MLCSVGEASGSHYSQNETSGEYGAEMGIYPRSPVDNSLSYKATNKNGQRPIKKRLYIYIYMIFVITAQMCHPIPYL